ncbi:hypothetical protein Mkiyose1665_34140 [Mycobacterium kiyosense]|uniref:Uncharacterized protein n=1 Tax=Mycobacterium gordonae TaxID=1778 RepID=A0A0Q2RX19_MYCGO|nr:hypothetical protein AO501_04115 [Mycobacterium gordonae]PJE24212.1 MAG: hypothetical protein CK431_07150 [Mycobacterium sp.]GLD42914.1 hypothetical protein Mkiyose1665_34140 [Mycobacterium kiyosense]
MATTPAGGAANNHDAGAVPLHERPEFIAWLTASCERQNLAVTVTDPTVIERVAILVGATRPQRPARHTRQTGATRSISRRREPGVPGAMTA